MSRGELTRRLLIRRHGGLLFGRCCTVEVVVYVTVEVGVSIFSVGYAVNAGRRQVRANSGAPKYTINTLLHSLYSS